MSAGAIKGVAIGCFVLCAILLFVAWERYHSNAQGVEAMNQMLHGSPFGGVSPLGGMMTGGGRLQPSMPTATIYALLFAAISAVGGVVCLVLAQKKAAP